MTKKYQVQFREGEHVITSIILYRRGKICTGYSLRALTNSAVLTRFHKWTGHRHITNFGRCKYVSLAKVIEFCRNPKEIMPCTIYSVQLRAFGSALEMIRRNGGMSGVTGVMYVNVPQENDVDGVEYARFNSVDTFSYRHDGTQQTCTTLENRILNSTEDTHTAVLVDTASGTAEYQYDRPAKKLKISTWQIASSITSVPVSSIQNASMSLQVA
jgi:hypothetical protein